MENKNSLLVYIDTLWLLIGELIVSLITVGVFALVGKFHYSAITGALLGSAVTVLNFFILSVGVNRAVTRYVEARGTREMDEEEAEKFASEHSMDVQNAMMKSYMLRMLMMIGSLVLAGFSGWFNVIATVVPLLMYRPLITIIETIKKIAKAGE